MTRPDLGTRPARDGYPPARPEVMDAAMVIFGAAVAARFGGHRMPLDMIDALVGEVLAETRMILQEATRQLLPPVTATLEAGGQLVIAWVVDGG